MTAEEEAARENEAAGLVLAMGQEVVFCETVRMSAIVPKSFFGKGTLERLRTACEEKGAELLVVDMPVSAVQQRNLEKMLNMKVIDRTAVILEIFGQRAQTREGKLQVELAHLTYQRGRLVRSWTHLERQRGGGGFLGGPGETQIELDRRHLDERIVKIKKSWKKSARHAPSRGQRALRCLIRWRRWSAIPTRGSRRCSTLLPKRTFCQRHAVCHAGSDAA